MTNQEYQKHLEQKSVKQLVEKYEAVFMVRPPSKYRKPDIIGKLCEKFNELNAENPKADEVTAEEPANETPSTPRAAKTINGKPSRRSTIIKLVTENIWDNATLAEWLNVVNPEWPVNKNKGAISGTLADMRKSRNWVVKTQDDNRIMVSC